MKIISPLLIFALLVAPQALAKSASAPSKMALSAKTTTYDGRAHTYTVTGDVHITWLEFIVDCDTATLYATVKEDHITRAVFTGNVTVKKGNDSFKANRVTFYVEARKLVAEGETHTRLTLPLAGAPLIPNQKP
jgi:lipopolysaccharide export system protein LptA